MRDLDGMLARLADQPVHAGLAEMEGAVFDRIQERSRAGGGMTLGAVAIAAALGMGVLGAGLPGGEVQASEPLSPLIADAPLAPSTLLVGDR